jgi:hypothetical protein
MVLGQPSLGGDRAIGDACVFLLRRSLATDGRCFSIRTQIITDGRKRCMHNSLFGDGQPMVPECVFVCRVEFAKGLMEELAVCAFWYSA